MEEQKEDLAESLDNPDPMEDVSDLLSSLRDRKGSTFKELYYEKMMEEEVLNEEGINSLRDFVADTEEFKSIIPKAGHRTKIRKALGMLQGSNNPRKSSLLIEDVQPPILPHPKPISEEDEKKNEVLITEMQVAATRLRNNSLQLQNNLGLPAKDVINAVTQVDFKFHNDELTCSEFFRDIKAGNLDKIKKALLRGMNPNHFDANGWTGLMYGTLRKNIEICQLFINFGADVNFKDGHGRTAIMFAAHRGQLEILELLYKNGGDINATTGAGSTALQFACNRGHTKVVLFLLKHCVDPNAATRDGSTPILKAARAGHKNIVRLLIGYGADINACSKVWGTLQKAMRDAGVSSIEVQRTVLWGLNIQQQMQDKYLELLHENLPNFPNPLIVLISDFCSVDPQMRRLSLEK